MRIFSLLVSLVLHGLLFAAMVTAVSLPLSPDKPMLELDLARMPKPEPAPVVVARPVRPEVVKPAPAPKQSKLPDLVPRLGKVAGKVVLPKAAPKSSPAQAQAGPPPPPPKEISEAKRDDAPRNQDPELEEFARSGGYIHPEAPDYLKHGAETRFGQVLGYYTYTIEQYVGQYSYDDGADSITIIDARNTPYKRLLFYDSRSGIFRSLKQFGRYIYSYGPAFGQDEPVIGSLVFLAKDDDIHRILWMPGGREPARFPEKTHFVERDVTFSRFFTKLSGNLIVPPGEGPFPAVVWLAGPDCDDRRIQEAAARQLGAAGIAVLVFDPRGRGASKGKPAGDEDLAADAREAVSFLRGQKGIDGKKVGIFARREGVRAALLATEGHGSSAPDFLVATLGAREDSPRAALLDGERLRKLSAPSLWLFAGPDPAVVWRQDLALLEKDAPPGLARVLLLPEEVPSDTPQWARDALRVQRMASGFTRFAAPWILER